MPGQFNPEHMYTYMRGYASAMRWENTLNALVFARKQHEGQTRKGNGEPYIAHPLTMACQATCIGIDNDIIVASCLLHDVPEDCSVEFNALPVCDRVREVVRRLTHVKHDPLDIYYRGISEDPEAALVKLLDRCHNVSSMGGAFSMAKIQSYIKETRDYVLPLIRVVKEQRPEYSDAVFVLKYHITSIIDSMEAVVSAAAGQTESEDAHDDRSHAAGADA